MEFNSGIKVLNNQTFYNAKMTIRLVLGLPLLKPQTKQKLSLALLGDKTETNSQHHIASN
jgi:hypothetical protein